MPMTAFSTIKGRVGKTTLCFHVAAALADAGHRVLLMDLDPQAHASMVLGLEPGEAPCVEDAFGPRPRHKLDEVVASPKRPNLFIARAHPRMAAQERELFQWGHRLQAVPPGAEDAELDAGRHHRRHAAEPGCLHRGGAQLRGRGGGPGAHGRVRAAGPGRD